MQLYIPPLIHPFPLASTLPCPYANPKPLRDRRRKSFFGCKVQSVRGFSQLRLRRHPSQRFLHWWPSTSAWQLLFCTRLSSRLSSPRLSTRNIIPDLPTSNLGPRHRHRQTFYHLHFGGHLLHRRQPHRFTHLARCSRTPQTDLLHLRPLLLQR